MAGIESLVRVVRSDADVRKKLVCKACFLAALAEQAPSVVKSPEKEKRWRRGELAAVADATIARMEGKDQMHCVVGTDEFSANLRYAKGSLVYLRADTTPPLRVLMYASLPPPPASASGDAHEPLPVVRAAAHEKDGDGDGGGAREGTRDDGEGAGTTSTTSIAGVGKKANGRSKGKGADDADAASAAAADDDDDADVDADADAVESIGAAKLVDPCGGASPVLITAVLEALAADPPPPPEPTAPSPSPESSRVPSGSRAAAERAAAWRGTRVRDSLTRRFGPFWHVVHDSRVFGGAVHVSVPGLKLVARRGKHDYLVWHHAAHRRTFGEVLARNVKWSKVLRAARYFFLVIVAAYTLWFRAVCVDVDAIHDAAGGTDALEEEAAEAGAAAAAAMGGTTGVGAGFDDRADSIEAAAKATAARAAARAAAKMKPPPLTMLEPSLRRWGCEAGPTLAPVAVALLAAMFVSGSGVFHRIGHKMAAKAQKRL